MSYAVSVEEYSKSVYNENKNILCLDIDDVLLDTECYLRSCVSYDLAHTKDILYSKIYGVGKYTNAVSNEDANIIMECMHDYSKIPFMPGAEDGLKILRCNYNVILCSHYMTLVEHDAKVEFAKSLHIPIILTTDKSTIDFGSSTMVDDSTRNLNSSNAERKICYYKKGNFLDVYNDEIVFDWGLLLDTLIK